MKCAWYEEQLRSGDPELWRKGSPTAALRDHAQDCATCTAWMDHEVALKRGLQALGERSRDAMPSAAVKRKLVAELDAMRTRRAPRALWIPRLGLVFAAGILFAVGLLFFHRAPQQQPLAQTATTKSETTPVVPHDAAPVNAPSTVATAKVPRHKVRPIQGSAQTQSSSGEFYPVVMCDSLTCRGPVTAVRVELPASPLTNAGRKRKVTADLLVGDDGLVRAVRFLR